MWRQQALSHVKSLFSDIYPSDSLLGISSVFNILTNSGVKRNRKKARKKIFVFQQKLGEICIGKD